MIRTNFIGLLLTLFAFISCESPNTKETKKIAEQKFSLENYLTKDGYVRLEMKKTPSGHLHLFGQLNGVDGNFILDTGAGATVIEEKNIKKFHLQTEIADEQATGAGGESSRRFFGPSRRRNRQIIAYLERDLIELQQSKEESSSYDVRLHYHWSGLCRLCFGQPPFGPTKKYRLTTRSRRPRQQS